MTAKNLLDTAHQSEVLLPIMNPVRGANKPRSASFFDVELDHQCDGQILCNAVSSASDVKIVNYHEAPSFLKHNHFVRRGYRRKLTFSGCIKSLFTWSNESVNIWTHLLGFFIFTVLIVYDNLVALPNIMTSSWDHFVISLGLVCFQFCMLCSTGYHVFNCHSERASRRWLMVDVAGICIGLIGCYIPAVHFAFYCTTIWRDLYLIIVTILCVCVLCVQLSSRYMSSNSNRYWSHRVALFIALVGYGVIPVCHWIRLNGIHSQLVQIFVPKVVIMYLLGVLALFVYLTRMPERCMPGYVDFVGSSHQLWHVLVVVAFLYWHNAGYEILLYRSATHCPADVV